MNLLAVTVLTLLLKPIIPTLPCDTALTGNGNDTIANVEAVILTGGGGNNTIDAKPVTQMRVTFKAGAGSDNLIGGAKGDLLAGEDGRDRLAGKQGDDLLYGGNAEDILYGY